MCNRYVYISIYECYVNGCLDYILLLVRIVRIRANTVLLSPKCNKYVIKTFDSSTVRDVERSLKKMALVVIVKPLSTFVISIDLHERLK